ncbi:MAG: hypothetical protein HC922_03085 [Leptolyngbyaceae cyanobacterium SM2_3_12]|nr:hypothetical protein [Leptolyngbyaceae cyanobacterium SM2_3_12]
MAYILTFLATLAVLWGLTSDFIQIRGIVWLPLIIALLPYNPEVFSTPLYIFWWTSLLLLLPLLRSLDNRINNPRERLTLVLLLLIGGLSSPLCIILLPLMLLRASLTRQRFDYGLLMVWTALSLLQLTLALWAPKGESTISLGSAINTGALPIFLGNYLLYDGWLAQDNWVTYGLFVALAILAIYGVIKLIQRKQVTLFYLVCPLVAMFGSITVSLIRVGFAPDPMNAGPRYFLFSLYFLDPLFDGCGHLYPPDLGQVWLHWVDCNGLYPDLGG